MDRRKMTSEQWYGRGEHFLVAADILKRVNNNLGYPIVVAEAFATECFLKCLSLLETGQYKEVHDLAKLLESTSAESRKKIADWWTAAEMPHGKPKALGLPPDVKVPGNFEEALAMSKDAFLSFRYVLDDVAGWWLSALQFDVRRRILELKPEWGANPPAPY